MAMRCQLGHAPVLIQPFIEPTPRALDDGVVLILSATFRSAISKGQGNACIPKEVQDDIDSVNKTTISQTTSITEVHPVSTITPEHCVKEPSVVIPIPVIVSPVQKQENPTDLNVVLELVVNKTISHKTKKKKSNNKNTKK